MALTPWKTASGFAGRDGAVFEPVMAAALPLHQGCEGGNNLLAGA